VLADPGRRAGGPGLNFTFGPPSPADRWRTFEVLGREEGSRYVMTRVRNPQGTNYGVNLEGHPATGVRGTDSALGRELAEAIARHQPHKAEQPCPGPGPCPVRPRPQPEPKPDPTPPPAVPVPTVDWVPLVLAGVLLVLALVVLLCGAVLITFFRRGRS